MKLDLTELYCQIDDFCQSFVVSSPEKLGESGKKTRNRTMNLKKSEMMTIIIAYHQVRFHEALSEKMWVA